MLPICETVGNKDASLQLLARAGMWPSRSSTLPTKMRAAVTSEVLRLRLLHFELSRKDPVLWPGGHRWLCASQGKLYRLTTLALVTQGRKKFREFRGDEKLPTRAVDGRQSFEISRPPPPVPLLEFFD